MNDKNEKDIDKDKKFIEDDTELIDKSTNTENEISKNDKNKKKIYPRPMTVLARHHESMALTISSLSMSVSLLSSILYKERLIYRFQILMVMFFSTIFWIKPRVGIRRTCDITFARFAVITSLYSSFYSDLQKEFLISLFICISSFLKASYQWERYKENWYLWHMIFHIFGNITNITLHHGRWIQRTRLLLN